MPRGILLADTRRCRKIVKLRVSSRPRERVDDRWPFSIWMETISRALRRGWRADHAYAVSVVVRRGLYVFTIGRVACMTV